MSDLISRSELLEIIKGSEELLDFQKDECIACINSCDIAYDIDKVVEELEIEMKASSGYSEERVSAFSRAIEIVKQGSVSDDVCELERGSSGYVGYPAYYSKCCQTNSKGLEMQTHIIANWKYCPYCGNKIKIKESD